MLSPHTTKIAQVSDLQVPDTLPLSLFAAVPATRNLKKNLPVASFYITPLIDPETIRKGQWEREPVQQIYLNRLVAQHKTGQPPRDWNTSRPPPGALLYPTLNQLDEWWTEFKAEGYDAISHDLETAGQFIIMDGLTPLRLSDSQLGRPLCLRFRGYRGCRWWSKYSEHTRAVAWLGKVLMDPDVTFIGHNVVGFDIPILNAHGLPVQGPILDTMVLMSRAYPELQKGLGFCATMFVGAPAWKLMTKQQAGAEGENK